MSAVKRVIEYHVNRLKDKRPEARLQAVKELELIGDRGVLDILRNVYETDEDGDVRKAAQIAGRTVFLRLKETE